jgi:hypothetical protein
MRFMIQLWSDERALPDEKRVVAMARYNDMLSQAGVLLCAEGLLSSTRGARIAMHGGQPVVVQGPFDDGRTPCVGFWLLRVGSKAEAVEWARLCPLSEGDILDVRQLYTVPELALTELLPPELLL